MSDICDICGEPLIDENVSGCTLCGRKFHMTWNTDNPIANCGEVWFDPRSNGMGFVCKICVGDNPWIKDATVKLEQPPS